MLTSSFALRRRLFSSQGFPIDEFVEQHYDLTCNAPNGPASCMAEKTSQKNALADCCSGGEKSIGYTCADGTVFCCNDPPQKQYNDGSPTNIAGYKNCAKVVPDYEEDAADIDAPAGSTTA